MLLHHIFTNYVCMYEFWYVHCHNLLQACGHLSHNTVGAAFLYGSGFGVPSLFYKISCPCVLSFAPTPVTDFMKLCMSIVPLVSVQPFHFFPVSAMPLWQPYCWDRHDACTILFSILKFDLEIEVNKLRQHILICRIQNSKVAVWKLCSAFSLIGNEMFILYFHSHKCGSIVKF